MERSVYPRSVLGLIADGRARLDEIRQYARPSAVILVSPILAVGPEALPSGVCNLDSRFSNFRRDECDFDIGRAFSSRHNVKGVGKSFRRVPGSDFAPLRLFARGSFLEDPPTDSRFIGNSEAGHTLGRQRFGSP